MKKNRVLNFLKIFMLQAFALNAINSYPNTFTANNASNATYDTIQADNAHLQYMGRVDFTNTKKPLFAYANITINTRFQGTTASMLINQYAGTSFSNNSFYAMVDHGEPIKIITSIGTTKYKIAENLPEGIHTLKIIKITEGYCGQCQFLGLILDKGKALEAPSELPALKLEYYGASTTVGYGIEGGARPGSDNSYKADPAVCARELNAQLSVVSLSGFGIAVGWTGLITAIWDKTIPFSATPAPANNIWDFTRYTPDVVVTELAANDYNATGGIKNGGLTTAQYVAANKAFLSKIRAKYPQAKIICTNTPMVYEPGFTIMNNAVRTTVEELASNGDRNLYYYGFPLMTGGGYNGHPGVTDGLNNGKALANFIKSTVLVGIEKDKAESKISVYPNPTSNILNINRIEDGNQANIKLFTSDGRLIYKKQMDGNLEQIDLKTLCVSGFVIVDVSTASNDEKFKVIIK